MSEQFYRDLLDLLYDGVYFVDRDRRITFWNNAAKRITGYAAEEVVGKRCRDNVLRHVDEDGNELCTHLCPLVAIIKDGRAREMSVFLHHKAGHRVPVSVRGTPLRDDNGEIIGAVEVFADNTERLKMFEMLEQYERDAMYDELTGVANRRFADIKLRASLEELAEFKVPFGLLFVDVDHFKRVNDTFGHDVGDEVLRMVARTMEAALRPMDVVCRWGGEEFVVILPNMDAVTMERIAERLRFLIEKSWLDTDQGRVEVTASVGGAIAGPHDNHETVVRRADERMYFCKHHGRNLVSIG